MRRAKYYPVSENYWYQVRLSESQGVPVPWQDMHLGVRKSINGQHWVSFPAELPERLKGSLIGKTWGSFEHALATALDVAKKSAGLYRKVHVVNYVIPKGNSIESASAAIAAVRDAIELNNVRGFLT